MVDVFMFHALPAPFLQIVVRSKCARRSRAALEHLQKAFTFNDPFVPGSSVIHSPCECFLCAYSIDASPRVCLVERSEVNQFNGEVCLVLVIPDPATLDSLSTKLRFVWAQ